MTISVKIIEDSIASNSSVRLATLHARYPRLVHSELMTHRVFTRNGRSSRAVPSLTLLAEEIYVPHMMKNKPGMQSEEELSPAQRQQAEDVWLRMAGSCMEGVRELHKLGVHKQWANRPLEWFGYIDVLISSTDWVNFFHLRDDKDAQPEIRELARNMIAAMDASMPRVLKPGEWHLPYVTPVERRLYDLEICKRLSVARCARISYKPFDGDSSLSAEIKRYEKLVGSEPLHASPAEHQATPDGMRGLLSAIGWQGPAVWKNHSEHGNFRGWRQYRKQLPNEAQHDKAGLRRFGWAEKAA